MSVRFTALFKYKYNEIYIFIYSVRINENISTNKIYVFISRSFN